MGRYFDGDIDGKFWFGLQASDVGERFGCHEVNENYVTYYTEDLEACQDEIKRIETLLGTWKEFYDKFFEERNSWSEETIKEIASKAGLNGDDARAMLSEYADLGFGKKVEQCLLDQGYCEFSAEF